MSGITGARQACLLLADGGVPARINGSSSAMTSVTVAHVWVEVVIGGRTYLLDPSVKDYTYFAPIDVAAIAGYSASDLMSAAGGSQTTQNGLAYFSGINGSSITQRLNQYAGTLLSHLRANHSLDRSEEVFGGRRLTQKLSLQWPRPIWGTLLYGGSMRARITDNLPDQYRTRLTLHHFLKRLKASRLISSLTDSMAARWSSLVLIPK